MSDNSAIISAYITNLGKYNEGMLVGKWHNFPTTAEELAQTFREIGIDGREYEEFFITDYETEVDCIRDALSEYESLDDLNYLASKLDDMTNQELEIYESAAELGDCGRSIQDLINLTENLDCYDFYEDINDEYDLGYYWVEESGCYDTKSMGSLTNYIDYERFGRDIAMDECGSFTVHGYIRNNGDSFDAAYDGINIPDEYRVFPKKEMYAPPQQTTHKPSRSHDAR